MARMCRPRWKLSLCSLLEDVQQIMKYDVVLRGVTRTTRSLPRYQGLPGSAADGETCQEALSNVEVIVDEWIETAQSLGRSIPEP